MLNLPIYHLRLSLHLTSSAPDRAGNKSCYPARPCVNVCIRDTCKNKIMLRLKCTMQPITAHFCPFTTPKWTSKMSLNQSENQRRDVNHSYSRRASSCPATHSSSVCISGEELAPSLSVQLLLIIQLDIKEIHQHSNYAVMMKTARSLREDTAAPPTQRLLPSLVFYSG